MEKHLEKSHIFSHIKGQNNQLKLYRGGEGTEDWVARGPAQPGLPGTFLVFALKVSHPEEPFCPQQNRKVGHPAVAKAWQ